MHALKTKYLEIDAALNTLFGHFLDYCFNAGNNLKPSKTGSLGLNAAFNIVLAYGRTSTMVILKKRPVGPVFF